MQRETIVKGRGLGGTSDLTLLAKIKPGFVESLESVTFKTRIKRVLDLLHTARQSTHEFATARLLSDAVERVGAIHSVRVAVLEPEDKVLLAVTFDGSWESYIRVLWDKVGTLLDLIFCGTEDYVTAADHSFAEWLEWARRVQVETGFFYGPPDATARDVLYHRRAEAMRQRLGDSELSELRTCSPSVEEVTQRLVRLVPPKEDDPQYLITDHVRMVRERIRNGLQSLAGFYRLADLHRPGTPDGDVLRRAALNLLLEFVQMHDTRLIRNQLQDELTNGRFTRQIVWLMPDLDTPAAKSRDVPPPAAKQPPIPVAIRADVQGGILRSYEGATHAVVMLLAFDTPEIAHRFLDHIAGMISTDLPTEYADDEEKLHWNLAFTAQGLRALGMPDDDVELFPEEFRQGMAARCGLLGDVRINHPRRWNLPRAVAQRKDPNGDPVNDADPKVAVELDCVHAVLQCRGRFPKKNAEDEAHRTDTHAIDDKNHPLHDEPIKLRRALPGLRILSLQSLKRRFGKNNSGQEVTLEHFGYADGNGQPDVEPQVEVFDRNRIQLGEVVLGHENAMDFAVPPDDPAVPATIKARLQWLSNGSFLVMRKYRQYVNRLETVVDKTAGDLVKMAKDSKITDQHAARELVYAKMMGRDRWGTPIVDPSLTRPDQQNRFDYEDDPQGRMCPFGAHIRRGHPRMAPSAAGRPPRIMRRSMSYGPKSNPGSNSDSDDRGLLFMAYNADLGQQFEVVQRWLVGGNSTGASSGQSCPIVGVPPNGVARNFRFEHEQTVWRMAMEANAMLFDEPAAVTRLEWGLYLFAPSKTAIRKLADVAAKAAVNMPRSTVPWKIERGRELLRRLQDPSAHAGDEDALLAWKAVIEDPDSIDRLDAASLWAAIREDRAGILRTPYGVIVADRELVRDVYIDPADNYSVCGQFDRMRNSFGEISLGLDMGPRYLDESKLINDEIGKLEEDKTYKLAFDAATTAIDAIIKRATDQAQDAGEPRFEVGFEAREITDAVLAKLSEEWFGLEDGNQKNGNHFRRGPTDWSWKPGDPPLYPGHFTALSRYMFQPHPGSMPTELGQVYGRALRVAMREFVASKRGTTYFEAFSLAKAIHDHPTLGQDDDFVARNMVGVLMGFNPTIIGAVLNVLREWMRDGTFGSLRAQLIGKSSHAEVQPVLHGPMAAAARLRPMPQLGWRTVVKAHHLGLTGKPGVELVPGDKIIIANVSATQQAQAEGADDHRAMFGGIRVNSPGPTRAGATHACPGYAAGIGAMMGALAAILCRAENLRPGVAPLTFNVDGPMPPRKAVLALPPARAKIKAASLAVPAGSRVLGWGDSWLDYRLPELNVSLGEDIRDCLQDQGFKAPENFCVWTDWPMIETMAADTDPFCEFLRNELQLRRPVAVLLSGGGNDSTEGKLKDMIVPRDGAQLPANAIDAQALQVHMDRLESHYRAVLRAIFAVYADLGQDGDPVPVFLHGYDYPLPRGMFPRPQWLRKPFEDHGYKLDQAEDMALATKGMATVIDEFNTRLHKIAGEAEFWFVKYVNLRGTLSALQKRLFKTDPQHFPDVGALWANDLHPTDIGFNELARVLGKEILSVNGHVTKPGKIAQSQAQRRGPPRDSQ